MNKKKSLKKSFKKKSLKKSLKKSFKRLKRSSSKLRKKTNRKKRVRKKVGGKIPSKMTTKKNNQLGGSTGEEGGAAAATADDAATARKLQEEFAIQSRIEQDEKSRSQVPQVDGGRVVDPSRAEDVPIDITIKITGKTDDIKLTDVNISGTIEDLKNIIEANSGIEFDKQILVFSGKQLEDGRTLEYYNIRNGSVLQLVIRGANRPVDTSSGQTQVSTEPSSVSTLTSSIAEPQQASQVPQVPQTTSSASYPVPLGSQALDDILTEAQKGTNGIIQSLDDIAVAIGES